jgi:hypothetical protein
MVCSLSDRQLHIRRKARPPGFWLSLCPCLSGRELQVVNALSTMSPWANRLNQQSRRASLISPRVIVRAAGRRRVRSRRSITPRRRLPEDGAASFVTWSRPYRQRDIHAKASPHSRDGQPAGLLFVAGLKKRGPRRRWRVVEAFKIICVPNRHGSLLFTHAEYSARAESTMSPRTAIHKINL